jgi:hypothetical protein
MKTPISHIQLAQLQQWQISANLGRETPFSILEIETELLIRSNLTIVIR